MVQGMTLDFTPAGAMLQQLWTDRYPCVLYVTSSAYVINACMPRHTFFFPCAACNWFPPKPQYHPGLISLGCNLIGTAAMQ